jgi:hypothetical protein
MWLNATTYRLGNFSAREFVIKDHCQVPVGSYIEPAEDPETTNTMAWRTEPSIALGVLET